MATIKQQKAFTILSENIRNPKPIPLGQIMLKAGYSIEVSKKPALVTKSKGFQELLEENMPDDLLQQVHLEILKTKKIEHMVFPLSITDEDITELINSVGGTVRKFQHSETATHVWFWAADGKIRLDAVKLAYQVKGKLTTADRVPEPANNTYNTFIQQNNVNPNAPKARELADSILDMLMEKTKRKDVQSTTAQSETKPLT